MLFNSAPFALFLVLVLALHRLLPPAGRNGALLAASLLFYFLWIPAYLLLLLFEIGVSYALLRALAASRRPRVWLALSVAFTLGLLAGFKYAAFLVESAAPALAGLFGAAPPVPDVLLPLGISFYSFQILALQVDVARGALEPPRSLARYALFVCFFPQLIAGPILRGGEFLPQLERGGARTPERSRRGLWLLAAGLAKKVILGDYLLAPFVDVVYQDPGAASAPALLVATYSFAFQIYFDFSGYTDMARGMALLLGFELPLNFREPYLSRSPAEFWRRWHITLSSWLRDYLYIPLGGSRGGRLRTARNLLLTMGLGGVWHGAGWGFALWGALHGVLLVAQRAFARRSHPDDAPLRVADLPRVALTFHAVCLLWIFFRAEDLEAARGIFAGLAGSYRVDWPLVPLGVVIGCAALHGLERFARPRLPAWRAALGDGPFGGAIEGLALGALAALVLAASGVGAEFIYFQF